MDKGHSTSKAALRMRASNSFVILGFVSIFSRIMGTIPRHGAASVSALMGMAQIRSATMASRVRTAPAQAPGTFMGAPRVGSHHPGDPLARNLKGRAGITAKRQVADFAGKTTEQ